MQSLIIPHQFASTNSVNKKTDQAVLWLRRGVWIYFALLLLEGALRKWILPELASPLLIVRDPLALWMIVIAIRKKKFPANIFAYSLIAVGFISFFITLFAGHGNFFVALFGLRILAIQFPLIFIIGKVFNRNDVVAFGKVMLIIAPFMTILIALQFYSPQSAWVNRGVGGNLEGAGFRGALGFFRPPGTFSFTTGTALFYGLLAPFLFYFWLNPKKIQRAILFLATISLLAAIPLSISRALFFSVALTILFLLFAAIQKPKYLASFLLGGLVTAIVFLVLGNADFFKTATDAFMSRFELANEAEGGVKGVLADRYLGGLIEALAPKSAKIPFFGYGLGMGTNVGALLLTGKTVFLISEGEWGRLIGEMGTLLGLLAIIIRLSFTFSLLSKSWRSLKAGNFLPWLLFSFVVVSIPQGQWAQPTNLGFSVLTAGLLLAALNIGREPVEEGNER